jgi:4-hydroxy-tetrahydrodipicolinate reductase
MKLAIIGYGKMGKEIERAATARGHIISLIIDINNRDEFTINNLKGLDAAVEFSTPESAFDNIIKCFGARLPVVSGTTGWLSRLEELKKICLEENHAFFYSPNFSIGVHILFKLNKELAQWMNKFSDYDISLKEIHHIHKKDKPSGTAIALAQGIIENLDRKSNWTISNNKHGVDTIPISSSRENMVPGTHSVIWNSKVDTIELIHSAKNRQGFALGAILATEFLQGKKGMLGMNDLLGF